MHGYKGTILRINLTDKSTELVQIPNDWYEKFIGGEGFAAKIIYDSLKSGIDPLGDENILVLSTGPLTGTGAHVQEDYVLDSNHLYLVQSAWLTLVDS